MPGKFLNPPPFQHRRLFRMMAWAIVLGALLQLSWFQSRPASPTHQAFDLATKAKSTQDLIRPSAAFDQMAREAGSGNVLLELAGPATTNRFFEDSLGYFYYRANYVLYPGRLYAADAGQIINNGKDIMRAGFKPAPQWQQAHSVQSVMVYDGDHAGEPPPHLKTIQPGQSAPATVAIGGSGAFLVCLIYLSLIVLVGYVVVSAIHPVAQMGLVSLTTLSAACGAGVMGLLLFWASLAGFAPSQQLLLIIAGLAVTGGLALRAKDRLIQLKNRPLNLKQGEGWTLIPAALIVLAFAVVAIGSLSTPLQEWDAFSIWGLKAKVLTTTPLHPVPPYFHDLSLSYSHLDYPLMLPFLTAGAYAAMNGVDDQTGKLVSVFLDVLVVPVIYLGLRWKLQRLPAACLAAILALLPVMFRFAGTGCADWPLAMFYAGSIIYVAKWLAEPEWPNLTLAVLFSAFAAFTKNEGLVLALANGVVILGFGILRDRRRNLIAGVCFFAGLLAVSAAWLVFNHGLPKTHEDYGSKLLSTLPVTNLPRLRQIIPEMLAQAAEPRTWGLLWIMTAMILALGARAITQRYVLAVWILLALHLGSYVLVYLVTPWDLTVLVSTTMDRLLLHATPAILLLTGWHWIETEKS